MIHIRGLRKNYNTGEVSAAALNGVDLDIPAGSFTALVGPSGCGKTTLLNMVGALDAPDAGTLVVGDVMLSPNRQANLLGFRRKVISIIFQFYNLLPTLTAQENIELVLESIGQRKQTRRERARALLSAVGLDGARNKLPGQLSGGEQQRVAIARALAKEPLLVLADEPTGSLDRGSGERVMSLMHELHRTRGTTFLIVTHDPGVAARASLVVQMEDGRILDVRGAASRPAT